MVHIVNKIRVKMVFNSDALYIPDKNEIEWNSLHAIYFSKCASF